MLALFTGPDTERPAAFFRYTVRADRARSQKIEAAAKKAGLSVEAFVQAHFERILAPSTGSGQAGREPFDADEFGRRHGVRRITALVYGELFKHAGPDNVSQATAVGVSRALDLRIETVREALRALCDQDLAENLRQTDRNGSRYRLKGW